jgi:hypothetical protein
MNDTPYTDSPDPMDDILRRGMSTDPLPDAALHRIRQATEREWRSATAASRTGPGWWRYASAAAALLVVVGGWFAVSRPPDQTPLATIGRLERIDYPGAVEQRPWARDRQIIAGESVHAGQRILVRGGARIALASAGTVRLAAGTDIEVVADDLIRLTDGSLYVDIPPEHSPRVALAILTPAGTFTHLGTQFQLAVHGEQTQLRVREGQVRWRSEAGDILSGAGTGLSIDTNDRATREQIPVSGADWQWAEMLAGSFNIDEHSLAEFLSYFARETGRTLQYADSTIERKAAATVLHGTMANLSTVETLSAVMATTSLRFTLTPNAVRIESADTPATSRR